ncbi:MAG: YlxR family protein [Oscillospiraceae bacterium]|nr:YlxR family protein [Oscillospiraceae bacterium]
MAKAVPVRLCLGCHEPKAKNEMLRIVRTGDGNVLIDLKGKVSGRGAYICKTKACFEKALKSKALVRSLGVSIPSDVIDSIKQFFDGSENG